MSARVQALLQRGIYSGVVRPEEWRADFAEIRKIDQHAESAASRATGTIVGGFIAASVSGAMLAAADEPMVQYVGIAGIGVGVLMFVLGFVFRGRAKAHDYENRRYELANELVQLISADLAPTAALGLHLDLRDMDSLPKPAERTVANGWKERHQLSAFLRLRAKLIDGTAISLVLTQHERKRSKWKTSASGKSKHKSKNASWLVAAVKVRMPGEQAHQLVQSDPGKAIRLPRGAHFVGLRSTKKGLAAQAWSEAPWVAPAMSAAPLSGRDLPAMLLVSLFQLVGQNSPAAQRSA